MRIGTSVAPREVSIVLVLLLAAVAGTTMGCTPGKGAGAARLSPADGHGADAVCEALLVQDMPVPLNEAFARLWLDRNVPRANQLLLEAYQGFCKGSQGMTADLIDWDIKWQMRTWIRIYYVFGSQGQGDLAGRLSPEVQRACEDLFWNYALKMLHVERAGMQYVWLIQGSENHDMMDLGNAYLALQAVAGNPAYSGRNLADGHSVAQHMQAWTAYYREYFPQRTSKGLLVEVFSPIYGKYFIPEVLNFAEFAADEPIRASASSMLDVLWADWAVGQLNGIRGGGKSRCYQGQYSQRGDSDAYALMGLILLETAQDPALLAKKAMHTNQGWVLACATTAYRLPEVVADLARSPQQRGRFVYVSRRPGRLTPIAALPPLGGHDCWYPLDPDEGRLVRYDYCTPEYVMGCFLTDPRMGHRILIRPTPEEAKIAPWAYAAISAQNRWQGIVYAQDINARIFPECLGKPEAKHDGLSVVDNAQKAVQHRNVMVVQANRGAVGLTAMRVFFSDGLKDRLQERDGWRIVQVQDAYTAIKALSPQTGQVCSARWDDEHYLRFDELYAPVIFVTASRSDFADLDAFGAYVASHQVQVAGNALDYRFSDLEGQDSRLRMYLFKKKLPEVNGVAVDLSPAKVYDCPYISSDFGSGVVTIRFGGRELIVNARPDQASGSR